MVVGRIEPVSDLDVTIRPDDRGDLDEVCSPVLRGFHMERMAEDSWVITANLLGGRRLYCSLWVEWRWRSLEPWFSKNWRRWIWFPWPHIEGLAEVEEP